MQEITTKLDGQVGWLTLNRPGFANAISIAMWQEIPKALTCLKDAGAQVVVIHGSGKVFASGADLNELRNIETVEDAQQVWFSIRDALDFVAAFPLPTIAAINGACMGGGCLLACACDLRYATEDSQFAVPVAKLGILLDEANILRLATIAGFATAKEMLLTGRTISSGKAEMVGLVNAVVAEESLMLEVCYMAELTAKNSFASINKSKKSLWRSVSSNQLDQADQDEVLKSYLSDDFRDRIKGV